MTTADVFAVGQTLTGPGGVQYTLRPLTQAEQGQYQRWLEQRAHDAVDRSNATEAAKDRRHSRIDAEAAMGYYDWEGPYALESVVLLPGLSKSLEIVCRDQGVNGQKAEEIVRHNAMDVARKILQAKGRDPKVIRSALQAMGLPTDWLESEESEPSSPPSSTPPSTDPSENSPGSPTTSSSSSTTSSEAPTG